MLLNYQNTIIQMKAKEYFKQYVDENLDKEPVHRFVMILHEIFKESATIAESRKAKSDSAMLAIMNEQNIKANSLIKMINEIDDLGIQRDSFKIFVNAQMPTLSNALGWSHEISTN